MNKVKNISAFLLLFTAVIFTSCSGDIEPYEGTIPGATTDAPVNPAANGTFKADFDGHTYTASQVVAIKHTDATPAGNITSYTISGNFLINNVTKSIVVQFFENPSNNYELTTNPAPNKGMGMINFIPDAANTSLTYTSTNQNDPFTSQGQINVSSNNATTRIISGTYFAVVYSSQVATDSKLISNGIFSNVQYTIQ